MTKKLMSTFLTFFYPLLPCFLLYTSCSCNRRLENGSSQINGMFVFGSSLVDNGNNNFVEDTTSRADYMPYGMDFPVGPTGRFSNGKNVIDVLSELLELPRLIPAFTNPITKSDIAHGVDYASGGSGILDDTGAVAGRVITLNQQIRNFEEVTLPELKTQLGSSTLLSNYLFVVGSGGNDYLLNYFLANLKARPSLPEFTANLTQTLSSQIQKLYSLGARKFVLISVYPLGCIPLVKNNFPSHPGCQETLNQVALEFNAQMKFLVDDLKPKLSGSALVYVDSYKIIMDIIQDPVSKGFFDATSACCEVLSVSQGGSGILCKRDGYACNDRRGHVFFDGLHPTERVNDVIAKIAFTSNLHDEVYPFNVRRLVELQVE